MTFEELVQIANRYYDDGWLEVCLREPETCGDLLGRFVVEELRETLDPDASDAEQLQEAIRCMDMAHSDIEAVLLGLNESLVVRDTAAFKQLRTEHPELFLKKEE